jgi:hypothetical protein
LARRFEKLFPLAGTHLLLTPLMVAPRRKRHGFPSSVAQISMASPP